MFSKNIYHLIPVSRNFYPVLKYFVSSIWFPINILLIQIKKISMYDTKKNDYELVANFY